MDNLHQYKAADINYVIIFHLFSSVRSSQIRNVNSARVSFPGQLKRITSGQTATSELDSGIAVLSKTVPSIPSVTSTLDGRVSSVSRLSSQPLVEDSEIDNSRSSEINSENNLEVDQNSTSVSYIYFLFLCTSPFHLSIYITRNVFVPNRYLLVKYTFNRLLYFQ